MVEGKRVVEVNKISGKGRGRLTQGPNCDLITGTGGSQGTVAMVCMFVKKLKQGVSKFWILMFVIVVVKVEMGNMGQRDSSLKRSTEKVMLANTRVPNWVAPLGQIERQINTVMVRMTREKRKYGI